MVGEGETIDKEKEMPIKILNRVERVTFSPWDGPYLWMG
jgi:hypothetical protein